MKLTLAASLVAGVALLSGCTSAFTTHVTPVEGAPPFPPTETSSLAGTPPPGAVHLATIEEQGTKERNSDDCLRVLQVEARKLGATHVIPGAKTEPAADKGPTCKGEAYRAQKSE